MMLAQTMSELSTLYAVFAAILGACFGSFAGLIIARLSVDMSIVMPASHCFTCSKKLRVWHNIPIVSWLLLRGQCAYCKTPIGIRAFVVEVILAFGFLALWLKFGFSIVLFDRALFLFLLVCIAYIDLDTFSIPLSLLLALFVVGVAANTLYFVWPHAYVAPSNPGSLLNLMVFRTLPTFSLSNNLIGAACGFLSLALVNIIATVILRRAGRLSAQQWAMGFGDAVLLSAIGLFVGARHLMVVVFLGSVLGSLVGVLSRFEKRGRKDGEIAEGALPYGPFLAIAAIYVYLF